MCIVKPEKWPINFAEEKITLISMALDDFLKNPTYENKEALISLVNEYDLNSEHFLGEYRITEYEVEIINKIYQQSQILGLRSPVCYCYSFVGSRARLNKIYRQSMLACGEKENSVVIKEYLSGLMTSLRLYYIAYVRYNLDKNKSFADKIIDIVEECIFSYKKECDNKKRKDLIYILACNYVQMLTDISCFHGNKKESIWEFDRDELFKLL